MLSCGAMMILFWSTITILFYTYVGYSVLILLLGQIIRRPVQRAEIEPMVTFLITAYNEEKSIAAKLDQVLSLDYPREKLEIIVASDGSTDRTDQVVRQYAREGVRLVRVEGRVGKTETQNKTVATATGEIILFSDATTSYEKSAVRHIVSNYADPNVGAVSGRYEYRNPKGAAIGFGSILFWKYENLIKVLQTRIRTITGCCGCIYSVRRELYVPLPADIISDLVEPLKILEKGYRIVFEPDAIAFEETTEKTTEEFSMRVRVITRGMRGLMYARNLLNPFSHGFVSFQLLSHKIMRWAIPFFLVVLFVSNIWLAGASLFYGILFGAQVVFYAAALAGFLAERRQSVPKLLSIPLYFVTVNVAAVVALFRVCRGYRAITWETVRT